MQTTIRVGEPRELLAFIPFQLGFEPHESAVVVSLRGSGRVGLVARVDLEDLTDAEDGPQLARSLVTYLVEDGARSAVLVLYSGRDLRAAHGGGLARAARAHLGRASEPFLTGVACWAVGPEGYYDPSCEDLGCCPPGGRPRTELESTAVSAQMVLEGSQVLPSRTDLGRVPLATDARRRSTRRAAARWAARLA
ncbi:DUF4192 family protein, partial [Actinotalea sp. C106]|uniref:DUF4192 family protein n=1 Tax=Actinotalea sp. C106 TaxID=2908644 RepID=UPI002027AFE3